MAVRARFLLLATGCAACAACSPGNAEDSAPTSPVGHELAAATVQNLPVAKLTAMQTRGHVDLIDVRSAQEFAEGHIAGARNIPLDQFDPAMLDAGSDAPVVIYCRSGRRSDVAARRLAAHTGAPATHLDGGIVAWEAAGQATVTQ